MLHTDARVERPVGRPYTPRNLLATIYHALSINPTATLPDRNCRPIPLLDDGAPVKELI